MSNHRVLIYEGGDFWVKRDTLSAAPKKLLQDCAEHLQIEAALVMPELYARLKPGDRLVNAQCRAACLALEGFCDQVERHES